VSIHGFFSRTGKTKRLAQAIAEEDKETDFSKTMSEVKKTLNQH